MSKKHEDISYLTVLIASGIGLVCIIFAGIISSIPVEITREAATNSVISGVLVNSASASFIFVAVYLVFSRKRLNPQQIKEDIQSEFRTAQIESLGELADRLPSALNPELRQIHYGAFNKHQFWTSELNRCQKNLVVIVYYFDSWVKEHRAEISALLGRGVNITLVMSDVSPQSLSSIFPQIDVETIKRKISDTPKRFRELSTDCAGIVDVVSMERPLSYSAVCFDDHKIYISFYEYGRVMGIESPVFEIDLSRSPFMNQFWVAERAAFGVLKTPGSMIGADI